MPSLLALFLTAAPLSFDDALSLAARAPQVAAAERAAAARRANASTVSSLQSNPTLGLQPGVRTNATGTGPEFIGTLTQSLNVSGYSGARREAVALEVAQAQGGARLEAHLARLSVADGWLRVWTAQGVLAEARRELDLASDLGGRVGRAAQSGAITRADAAAVRAWVAEARLAVLSAEGELFDTGVQLNRALGLDAAAPAQVAAELPELGLPQVEQLAQSLGRAEHAPAVKAALQLRDAEEARARELVASKGTWLQVGATGGREGLGDVVVLGTLAVTIPVFDSGERDAAPLHAAATQAEGARLRALAEARAERVLVTHELEHTRETLEVVERELVPASDEAAQGTQRRMEAGEATSQEWVLARRAALAAHSRWVRARAEHALARFRARELVSVTSGESP
ncbi:MAG: TolC family protein [Archangium sp.]|nr:TolC family protein [Archangium sp.]